MGVFYAEFSIRFKAYFSSYPIAICLFLAYPPNNNKNLLITLNKGTVS